MRWPWLYAHPGGALRHLQGKTGTIDSEPEVAQAAAPSRARAASMPA